MKFQNDKTKEIHKDPNFFSLSDTKTVKHLLETVLLNPIFDYNYL
jgi:hypothetical protein